MATWIAHMRVAERLMAVFPEIECDDFLAGNIAPDCGVPNEDRSVFAPPKSVTHFYDAEGSIDAERFRREHLIDQSTFCLGYYFHLLTDMEWGKLYKRKNLEPAYRDGLSEDSSFIWTIKKDWYGQDHLYLQRNPDSVFFRRFSKLRDFQNVYLDFFPTDAFLYQFNYIIDFYNGASEDASREFPYLSRDEMDGFIDETASLLSELYRNMTAI